MTKQTKAVIITGGIIASLVTPMQVDANTQEEVAYLDIVTASFMQEALGANYQDKYIEVYSNTLKIYFENEKKIYKEDAKNVLAVVNGYINLSLGKKTELTTKGNLQQVTKDLEVLNYIENMLQMMKGSGATETILSDLISKQQSLTGNTIGDKVKDINEAITAGVKYVTNSNSLMKSAFETELSHVKDGVLRKELSKGFEDLKEKQAQKVTYLWDNYTKEQIPNYKVENRQLYNHYNTLAGTAITGTNVNDFLQVVNLLVEVTKDTTAENITDLKKIKETIRVSDLKTLIDDTVRTLENLVTHTNKSVTPENVDSYVTELTALSSLVNGAIGKHEDTLKYDLLKTLGAINKIEGIAKAESKDAVSNTVSEILKILNNTNSLHNRIEYITTVQRTQKDKTFNSLDIGKMEEDQTIVAKGYTSTARSGLYNPFTDIDTVYSKDEILELYNNGKIIGGTSHDTYSPRAQVTRAQFAVMIARATGDSNEKGLGALDTKNRWYDNHLPSVVKEGIMPLGKVGSDGRFTEDKDSKNFHPNEGMQRKDMAVYLVRMLKESGYDVTGMATKSNLLDVDDNLTMTTEEKDAVRVLEALDIIHGKDDGTFSPYEVANRAQVAKVLYKVFELTGHLGQ